MQIEGQLSLFDFLEEAEEPKVKRKRIQINRALPILECHPRTIETFRQIANIEEWKKKAIEDQYNNNPYDLNELADVCKKSLGIGGKSTFYGIVNYNEKGWSYRFKKEWEGVYVEELSWREYARDTVCLMAEGLWNNFPAEKNKKTGVLRKKYDLQLPSKRWLEEDGYCDIWHYTDEENPDEVDIYWCFAQNYKKYEHSGYYAWAKDKWWWYDTWKHEWKSCNDNHVVIGWMKIPTNQRNKDVMLPEMFGMNGII